jgi:predicted ArsR family transcriptional regulator
MRANTGPERRLAHAALAVPSRAQLLELLRGAERARTVQELAESSGLHVNTVRHHLDVLVEAGLAAQALDRSGRRGRPRMVYSATATRTGADYQLLAGTLARHWAGTPAERARRAEAAGYGVATVPVRDRPARGVTLLDAVREVAAAFDRMGFEPEVVPDDVDDRGDDRGDGRGGGRIRLHHCPFRAVAEQDPDVVCSLHLGMIRRILDDARAPDASTRLEPFVEPSLCVAHVSARDSPTDP